MSSRVLIGVSSVAVLMCVFSAGLASADPLATSLLYLDGSVTQLEDNDWETIIEKGTIDGIIEQGDVFVGMFDITDVYNMSTGAQRNRQPEMFAGVFVATVAGVAASDIYFGGTKVYLAPAAASDWTALGLDAPTHAGTMAMVYSDPDGPQNMVNPGMGSLILSLATATNGTKLWEVGFRGEGGEFWVGDANATVIPAVTKLSYEGSLNITASTAAGSAVTLVKHGYLYGPNVLSEVQFQGRMEAGYAGDFMIRTDSDFYLKAVPEPSTVVMMAFGLAALALGAIRARRG